MPQLLHIHIASGNLIFDIEQVIESAGARSLNNIVLLVDLISITLETDDSGSVNFTVTGESISMQSNKIYNCYFYAMFI